MCSLREIFNLRKEKQLYFEVGNIYIMKLIYQIVKKTKRNLCLLFTSN